MVIKRTIIASVVAAVLFVSPRVWADDMQDIRNEIKEIRESYEARIKNLEDRLKAAEAKAAEPSPQVTAAKSARSTGWFWSATPTASSTRSSRRA